MTAPKENGRGAWAFLGKIAVLLGAIWVSIQIIDNFIQKKGLSAKGSYNVFEIPYPVRNEVRELSNVGKSWQPVAPELASVRRHEIVAKAVSAFIDNSVINELLGSYSNYNAFVVIDLKNTANREIKDITLDTPWEGLYVVTVDEKSIISSGRFEKTFPLGKFRPLQEAKIRLWIRLGHFPLFYKESARLTYPDGFTNVDFSVQVYGTLAWIATNLFFIVPIGISLSLILLYILSSIIFSKKKNPEAPESTAVQQ